MTWTRSAGRVEAAVDRAREAFVRGVALVKRHTKPNPQRQIKGGIADREDFAHSTAVYVSNVAELPESPPD